MIKKFCSYTLSAIFCFGGNSVFSVNNNISQSNKYTNNLSSIKMIKKNKNNKKKSQKSVCKKKSVEKINKISKETSNKQQKSNFSGKANEVWDKIYDNRGKVQLLISFGLKIPTFYHFYCTYRETSREEFLSRINEFEQFLERNNVSYTENRLDMYLTNCYNRAKTLLGCVNENHIDDNFKMKVFTIFARVGFFRFVDILFELNIYDGHSFTNIKNISDAVGDEIEQQTIVRANGNRIRLVLSRNDVEREIKAAERYNRKIESKFKKLLYSDIEERINHILEDENNWGLIENLRIKMKVLLKSDLDLFNWFRNNLNV